MKVETNCPCCGAAIIVEVNTRSANTYAVGGGGYSSVSRGGVGGNNAGSPRDRGPHDES